MKILIVEDDPISRKVMQKTLTQYGECDVLDDGLEALDTFLFSLKSGDPYHYIFLDVMLPKVDGMKVLKTIRDIEIQRGVIPSKRVNVILTTALADTDFVKDATSLGCEDIFSKPIDIQKIKDLMNKNSIEK